MLSPEKLMLLYEVYFYLALSIISLIWPQPVKCLVLTWSRFSDIWQMDWITAMEMNRSLFMHNNNDFIVNVRFGSEDWIPGTWLVLRSTQRSSGKRYKKTRLKSSTFVVLAKDQARLIGKLEWMIESRSLRKLASPLLKKKRKKKQHMCKKSMSYLSCRERRSTRGWKKAKQG